MLAAYACGACAYLLELSPQFIRRMGERFGTDGVQRLERWRTGERQLPRASDDVAALLTKVNALANRLSYEEDMDHWAQAEYWATPAEFVASGGGDCEDYAIAKYFGLRAAGVPADRLRMVYVQAVIERRLVNHMVLAYYERPDADPLILDNLRPEILPASRRPDLSPVFSFNDDERGNAGRDRGMARRWRELQERIVAERAI